MPDATTREHTNPGATFFKLRDLFYVASIFRMTGMRASPTECATDVSMNSGILHVYGAGLIHASACMQGCWAHTDFGALLAVLTDRGEIVFFEEASQSSAIALRKQALLLHEGCQAISFGPKEHGLQLASGCSKGHIRCLTPPTCSQQLKAHCA